MNPEQPPVPRVLVGAVMAQKSRTIEELARIATEEVRGAGLTLVRNVVVNPDAQIITQLIENISNDNEADVILLLGGAGFGPRDHACDAVNQFVERRIEGFGQAYRRLLVDEMEFGPHAWMVRATAGVFNQCLVFVMTGRPRDVQRAMQKLVVPTIPDAVALATGRMRAVQLKA
ncbi:MAG TPA: molybdopterin-binding protein [Polyangiaceae bacterium]